MISARTDTVQRAVALIGPDKSRHAECVNAVNVALVEIKGTEADLRYMFLRNTKRAKRSAARLETAIARLQDVLNDPNIPEDLLRIFPNREIGLDGYPIERPDFRWPSDMDRQRDTTKVWLTEWRWRAGAASKAPRGRFKFHFEAEKKLIAAEQAHRLLKQFGRDISVTEGSTFCRLAALLYGKPKANFHHPCQKALRSARK